MALSSNCRRAEKATSFRPWVYRKPEPGGGRAAFDQTFDIFASAKSFNVIFSQFPRRNNWLPCRKSVKLLRVCKTAKIGDMNDHVNNGGLTKESIAELIEYCVNALKDDFPVNALKFEIEWTEVKLMGIDSRGNDWEESINLTLKNKHDKPLETKQIIEKTMGDMQAAMKRLSKRASV